MEVVLKKVEVEVEVVVSQYSRNLPLLQMIHVEGKEREHFVLAFLSGCHQFEFRTQHRECQTRPLRLESYICFFAHVSLIYL